MTEALRKQTEKRPVNRARDIFSSGFEFVLAKGGIPTIDTVVAALRAHFAECSPATRIPRAHPGPYAELYSLTLNDAPVVLKLVQPGDAIPFDVAVDHLNQHKVALTAGLPGLPSYLGALRNRDGFLVATLAGHIEGPELPTALIRGVITHTAAEDKIVAALKGFLSLKFNLIETEPTNFIVTPDTTIVLVNGGALDRRQLLIERFSDIEVAQIQLIHSAFFEKRGETIRKLTLREIAALVLRRAAATPSR